MVVFFQHFQNVMVVVVSVIVNVSVAVIVNVAVVMVVMVVSIHGLMFGVAVRAVVTMIMIVMTMSVAVTMIVIVMTVAVSVMMIAVAVTMFMIVGSTTMQQVDRDGHEHHSQSKIRGRFLFRQCCGSR